MSTRAQLDQPMGEWLATADVGARYGVPVETVRYWRHISYGPVPIKLGRHVRYRADGLGRLHSRTPPKGRRGRRPLTPYPLMRKGGPTRPPFRRTERHRHAPGQTRS